MSAAAIYVALGWPPRELHPNARAHWAVKAKKAKAYRRDALFCTPLARTLKAFDGDGPINISITFHPPDKRHRDLDGALSSIKSGLDGIADALGVNDRRFLPTLAWGPVVKHGRVVVRI